MQTKTYQVSDKTGEVAFLNAVDFCVGTGRMGLALTKEYYDQLKLVQEEIGFKHIRGHGLFSDDMAIYQETKDREGNVYVEYNFTYLDRVMDMYRELNLKPFLELGFMPAKLASGEQTIFYWKGNTTPPKEYEGWVKLLEATLTHLMKRYGADEVVTWPIEVWNEPNLPGFWKGADMQEYFHLFEVSFDAIKAIDPRFRVGGPAICGVNDAFWIRSFMEFCRDKKIKVDFITRHHYTTEFPEPVGHYGYARLQDAEAGFANLQSTRDIVDEFKQYKGLEIHITEFNTSYIPNCPLHDTNQNAAYLAEQLSRLGDVNTSYSYWTFGDVFEEQGVPYTPFHGGFGMVANGCIKKPTFYTFAFFKKLGNAPCLLKTTDSIVVKDEKSIRGVVWNKTMEGTGETKEINFKFTMDENDGEYCFLTKTVDEQTTNPLKIWHDLGEPAYPSKEETELLRACANPLVQTENITAKDKTIDVTLTVKQNGVIYFELVKINRCPDRGYSYERVLTCK